MINKKTVFLSFIFMVVISIYLFSDISEARNVYKNGNSKKSLELYDNWLKLNHQSEDFTSVLFEILELNTDIYSLARILEEQIQFVDDRNKKKELFNRLGQLYELSSNLQDAQLNYQYSALSMLDKIDYNMLLKSAELLLLEGNLFLAESQLSEIMTNSNTKSIEVKAKLLTVVLNILNSPDKLNKPAITNNNSPESLYIYYIIYSSFSDKHITESIIQKLTKDFGNSPEAAIIKKEINELPNILLSLGLLQNNSSIYSANSINFMIQTGSFNDQENAQYLAKDLINEGFSAIVEEQTINNTKYYKVILYFTYKDQMLKSLILLKKKGFEGFPIY